MKSWQRAGKEGRAGRSASIGITRAESKVEAAFLPLFPLGKRLKAASTLSCGF